MFVYSFQLTPGYRYQISQSEHAAGVGAFFILRAIDFTRQLRMDGLPREQRRLVWPSGERLHVTPNARVVKTVMLPNQPPTMRLPRPAVAAWRP